MIALIALLTALYLINDRLLRINVFLGWTAPSPAFSFSIVAVIIAGYVLGWRGGLLVALLGQLVGPAFWPIGGPIWLELTLSWAILGAIVGFVVYRRRNRTTLSLAINLAVALVFATIFMTFVNTAIAMFRFSFEGDWYWTQIGLRLWRFIVTHAIVFIICLPLIRGIARPIERFILIDTDTDGGEDDA